MTEAESRGTFLYEASRSLLSTSPALSRYYGTQFQQLTEEDDDIHVHPTVQQHMCPQCGQMYTPGLNCKVALRRGRRRTKRTTKREDIVYTCRACHGTLHMPGSTDDIPRAPTGTPSSPSTTATPPASAAAATETTPRTKNNAQHKNTPHASGQKRPQDASAPPAGKKKNKKKKNNLQTLLAEKKERDDQNQSFSLGSFLESL